MLEHVGTDPFAVKGKLPPKGETDTRSVGSDTDEEAEDSFESVLGLSEKGSSKSAEDRNALERPGASTDGADDEGAKHETALAENKGGPRSPDGLDEGGDPLGSRLSSHPDDLADVNGAPPPELAGSAQSPNDGRRADGQAAQATAQALRAGQDGRQSAQATAQHFPDGPEGPVVPAQNVKEPDMQLARPYRLRTFPTPASTTSASSSAATPTASEGEEVAQINRTTPVTGVGIATRGQDQRNSPPLPRTAEVPDPLQNGQRVGTATISTIVAADRRPAQTAQSLMPQALAGYSALAAGEQAAKLQQSDVTPLDDLRLDPLAPRPAETAVRLSDTVMAAPRHSADTAEALAKQLSQIAQNAALHRREIMLQPEELGRVRLALSASETAVNVSITVERPETLDLMRRYIGQLADEFRALGYQDVSFEFAQQQEEGTTGQSPSKQQEVDNSPLEEPQALPAIAQSNAVTSLIDRRI